MRTVKVKPLTAESFRPYGSYASITNPTGNHMGDFYNDQVLFPVSGSMPLGLSPLVLHKAEKMVVTASEYHNTTGEAIVVMDDDIIFHAAPPTKDPVPELTEAFYVPCGTVLQIHTGVWHYGGFPVNREQAHVLIVLPQRIYKNDCVVVQYEEKDQIEIIL